MPNRLPTLTTHQQFAAPVMHAYPVQYSQPTYQQQQQQQSPLMEGLQSFMRGQKIQGMFDGAGAGTEAGAAADVPLMQTIAPAELPAAGGTGGGFEASQLMSNPYGWAAAMLLAQNVMHNKDIASWQDALKGRAGAEAGEHFLDQWGISESNPLRYLLGGAGLSKKGGVLINPARQMDKVSSFIEDIF